MTDRVLVTRAAGQAGPLAAALREHGLEPVLVPAIEVALESGGALAAAVRGLTGFDWVAVTSANAVAALSAAAPGLSIGARPRWAAIGDATAAALEGEGIGVGFMPASPSAAALTTELPILRGSRVLVPHGDLADGALGRILRDRGAEVVEVVAYRTREAPSSSRPLLRAAFADGAPAAALLTSGSTARGLAALGAAESIDAAAVPAICSGPDTADAAREAGFHVLATAPAPDAGALAATAARALAAITVEIP